MAGLLLLLLLLLAGSAPPAEALSCADCRPEACVAVSCPGGRDVVLDVCGCCSVCARAEGESCGGYYDGLGRCGPGLQCRRRPRLGQLVGASTEGVCTRTEPAGCEFCQLMLGKCVCTEVNPCPDVAGDPTSFTSRLECEKAASQRVPAVSATEQTTVAAADCDGVTCPHPAVPRTPCPADSVLKTAPSGRPDCCPPISECVCDLESCPLPPVCAEGQPTVVESARLQPGHCCSTWTCKVTTDLCANATCPEVAPCPADSYRTAPSGCCAGECVCQPGQCRPPQCTEGAHPRPLAAATGRPGACCPVFQCEEHPTCVHGGRTYQAGDTWRADRCTLCHCKDAVVFCDTTECPPLGACSRVVSEPDQCCPRCVDGCRSPSGVYHNSSEQWLEDDCTTCSCTAGKLHCHAQMCETPCHRPRYVPGRCCPVCDSSECDVVCEFGYRTARDGRELCECLSAEEVAGRPVGCRSMASCKRKCSHGFKLDSNGCERCKCHRCRRLKGCSLNCPAGLAVNERGCRVCRCRPTPTSPPRPATTAPSVAESSCRTTEGELHVAGSSWFDGCRQCYCHNGTEMCSVIACAVPHCEHPEIEPGHCCPTCPDAPPAASGHVNLTVCLSAGGTYVDGQSWQLDTCTRCLCLSGRVLCSQPICPPAACPQPELLPGACCPTCTDDRSAGGSTDRPADSSTGGRACIAGAGSSRPDGDTWRSSACVSCRCRDGASYCFHERCPPLDCQRPVLSKGRCCPHCIEPVRDTSCVVGNDTVPAGHSWSVDACTSCVCQDGQLSCAHKVCSTTCNDPPPPGQCCPVCNDEGASSRTSYPFLNGTSKVAHRIRVPAPEPPTQRPHPGLQHTDGSQPSLLQTVLFSVLGVVLVLVVAAVLLCVLHRRRSAYEPKQQLHIEDEKKPLNGITPLPSRRPAEPSISVIRPT